MRKTILILMVLGLSSTMFAQGLGIGPVLGYSKAADAEEGTLMGGLSLRARLSPALGVEGSILYRSEKYAKDRVTVKNWPVMATALIYPIPIAYGAIGAGWYNTTITYDYENIRLVEPDDETSQEFGWHFGGGVELPLGPSTKFTGDIRYVFIDYDFEEAPGQNDVESDFFVINVGILFGL